MKRKLIAALLLVILALTCSASASPKYVVLTFDDGPSGKFTERLLEGLSSRNVHATFFLCGYRLRQYPETAQKLIDAGHEIGCHGDTHGNMAKMGRRVIDMEITDMLDALPWGTEVRFLRPPGGCCSDNVRQVAEAKNMPILSWSIDPKDWATSDIYTIETRVVDVAKDGDVILLHDMTDSSVDAALDIVDKLQARGFTFVTASELVTLRGLSLKGGKCYHAFPPKQD